MDAGKFEQVEVTCAAALWTWFEANHTQEQSIWLVTWKAAHRAKYVSRAEVLDVVIAFGWIDGRRLKRDADRTMQLLAPRKQQVWAQSYKDRAAGLIADGRMHPAGHAAIARSKALGRWDAMADVDALEVPDDLVRALTAQAAEAWWRKAAPSYRRNVLRWIAGAKKQDTRAKRIGIVAGFAAMGQKVPHY